MNKEDLNAGLALGQPKAQEFFTAFEVKHMLG